MARWTPGSDINVTVGPRSLADPDAVRASSPLAPHVGVSARGSSLWRDGVRRLRRNEAPSHAYPLGTDQLGRDLLSRMIYGARVSMLVGLGAQLIIVAIGVPIGALSGFVGGRTDLALTRFIDVMYAFPRLLFVILVMSMLGAGLTNIFIAIGLTGWVGIARQTRAQALALKEKEFVDGARALGAGFGRVLGRHVMPNALTPIIVAVTFGIAVSLI